MVPLLHDSSLCFAKLQPLWVRITADIRLRLATPKFPFRKLRMSANRYMTFRPEALEMRKELIINKFEPLSYNERWLT